MHFLLVFIFYLYVNRKSELLSVDKLLHEQTKPIRYFFMGDSHTIRSVDFEEIPGSYNFAFFSENNIYTYYKLKYVIEGTDKKIKVLVLPNDFTNFMNGTSELDKNYFYYSNFVDFSELSEISGRHWHYLCYRLSRWFFPYVEFRDIFNQNPELKIKKGYVSLAQYSSAKNNRDTERFFFKVMKKKSEIPFSEVSLKYLEKTILLCRDNDIRIVFVKYPMSSYFFNASRQFIPEKIFSNRPCDEIIRKFDHCTILDFERHYVTKDEYFFDSHHLNLRGKEDFTKILKEKLDSLVSREN